MKKGKQLKKLLAGILSVSLILSALPVGAWADEGLDTSLPEETAEESSVNLEQTDEIYQETNEGSELEEPEIGEEQPGEASMAEEPPKENSEDPSEESVIDIGDSETSSLGDDSKVVEESAEESSAVVVEDPDREDSEPAEKPEATKETNAEEPSSAEVITEDSSETEESADLKEDSSSPGDSPVLPEDQAGVDGEGAEEAANAGTPQNSGSDDSSGTADPVPYDINPINLMTAYGTPSTTYAWAYPLEYDLKINQEYSMEHPGLDLNAPEGAKVLAGESGIVTKVHVWNGSFDGEESYGNYVEILYEDGFIGLYSHLSEINVSVGEHVSEGRQIGLVGSTGKSTGPHLHLEIRRIRNGQTVGPSGFFFKTSTSVPQRGSSFFPLGSTPQLTGAANIHPGATMTVDEWMGTTREAILAQLKAHENDTYYLTTPYGYGNTPEEVCRPNGWNIPNPGMSCTGFVAAVFRDAGVSETTLNTNLNYMTSTLKYCSAMNWAWSCEDNTDIIVYKFKADNATANIQAALDTGVLRKGDILVFTPVDTETGPRVEYDQYGNARDSHIGFYWGENLSKENKFWHSAYGGYGSPYNQISNIGNQITVISAKYEPCYLYVLPLSQPDEGTLTVTKSSANTALTNGNRMYDLTGTEYTIYTDAACSTIAKDVNGNNAVITIANNNGTANVLTMKAGSYWIKETKAGKGYYLDATPTPVTLAIGENKTVPLKDIPNTDPIGILLKKLDKETGKTSAQGNGSLAGAEFTVKYYDNQTATGTPLRTWVFKTDANGRIHLDDYSSHFVSGDSLFFDAFGDATIPIGTITIQETKAPTGYLPDNTVYTVHFTLQPDGTVRSDNGDWNTTNQLEDLRVQVEETSVKGGVKFSKIDHDLQKGVAQGDATLKDAVITIYNNNGKSITMPNGTVVADQAAVMTVKTDVDGNATTTATALPYGTYYAMETTAPAGYQLNSTWRVDFSITQDGVIVDKTDEKLEDTDVPGTVQVIKKTVNNLTQEGDASVEGIKFAIVNRSTETPGTVFVNGKEYAKGQVVQIITTDASGTATSSDLPYGTYSIYELRVDTGVTLGADYNSANKGTSRYANNKGILFDSNNRSENQSIRTKGQVLTCTFTNAPETGTVSVTKSDSQTTKEQGDAKLAGIRFAVVNRSSEKILRKGEWFLPGEVVFVLPVRSDGTIPSLTDLTYGRYEVIELRVDEWNTIVEHVDYDTAAKGVSAFANNTGYLYHAGNRQPVNLTSSNMAATVNFTDDIIRGGIEIEKVDAITQTPSNGDAKVQGIRFVIVNESQKSVHVNGQTYEVGQIVRVLTIGADGKASTGDRELPYGTYRVYELRKDAAADAELLGEDYATSTKLGSSNMANDYYTYSLGNYGRKEIRKDGDIAKFAKPFENRWTPVGVYLQKTDRDNGTRQGDASLAGIDFALVNSNGASITLDNGSTYAQGAVIAILTTKEDGSTDQVKLPAGKYSVYELRMDHQVAEFGDYASADKGTSIYANSTGYLFQENKEENIDPANAQNSTYKCQFSDIVVSGDVSITKSDSENGSAQGDASLEGIGFAIVNRSQDKVVVNGEPFQVGEVAQILTTKADGTTDKVTLPYGTYAAYELRADTGVVKGADYDSADKGTSLYANDQGYLFKENKEENITIRNQNESKTFNFADDIVKGGVSFRKIDKETGEANPQGRASFEGTEITIYNNSKEAVLVNGTSYGKGQAILVFTLDKEGKAATGSSVLPYGTYFAKETKNPEGYDPNNAWQVTFQIREKDVMVDTADPSQKKAAGSDESGWLSAVGSLSADDARLSEQITRANLSFFKIDVDGKKMPYIPFLVSRLDDKGNVVESHVIITDKNGRVNTANRSKTNVNTLDSYLVGGRYTGPLDDTAAAVNVWFGEDDAESKAANLGSLIYATYRVEELRCDLNDGHSMLLQEVFESDDEMKTIFTKGAVLDLKNIFIDLTIHPESDLKDDTSDSKVITIGNVTVTDTIRYDNLKIYTQYKIQTDIYYVDRGKSAADRILIGSGDIIFTPKKVDATDTANGTIDNQVTVDSSICKDGGKVHAVDTLYAMVNGSWEQLLVHNEDLDIQRQTLYIPYMETFASDTETGDHQGRALTKVSIADIITYEGLADLHSYRIEEKLMVLETGEQVGDTVIEYLRINYLLTEVEKRENGYVGPKDGKITMPAIEFDGSKYEGLTLVVYETLYDDDTNEIIVDHSDPNDKNQTVYIPKIGTTAKNGKSGTKMVKAEDKAVIVDTVSYSNLIPNRPYTFKGYLMNYSAREKLLDANGKEITAEVTVTITEPNGTIDMTYEFDASLLEGQTIVVFEDLYSNGKLIAVHHELEDKDQTVYVPKIGTTLTDKVGEHVTMATKDINLVDTVKYENLQENKTYTFIGILMDKDTGLPILDDSGKQITAEKEVLITKSSGTVDVEFHFSGVTLMGKSVVAFEKVIQEGQEVAVHTDINDTDQTVDFPEIGTTLIDRKTGDHEAKAEETIVLVDTIAYDHLTVNETYTFLGVLMDLATGEKMLDDNGKEITAETEVLITKSSGTVDVEFTFSGVCLAGKSVVAFETVLHKGKVVAVHAELTDANQTVDFPKIKTTLQDTKTGDHYALAAQDIVLVDTITYENLKENKTYTFIGTLMDKKTGEPILDDNGKEITASTDVLITKSSGTVDVEFHFSGICLAGKTVVAFERALRDGKEVAVHADINDTDQTVDFPKIGTKALTEDQKQTLTLEDKIVEIFDEISYENLIPGKAYWLKTSLVNKATGEKIPFIFDEGAIRTEDDTEAFAWFIPEESSGTVRISVKIDLSKLPMKTEESKITEIDIVFFEELWMHDPDAKEEDDLSRKLRHKVAEHKDIQDKDQTIKITDNPKTGDSANMTLYGATGLVSLLGAAILANRKRKVCKTEK